MNLGFSDSRFGIHRIKTLHTSNSVSQEMEKPSGYAGITLAKASVSPDYPSRRPFPDSLTDQCVTDKTDDLRSGCWFGFQEAV